MKGGEAGLLLPRAGSAGPPSAADWWPGSLNPTCQPVQALHGHDPLSRMSYQLLLPCASQALGQVVWVH